MGFQTRLCSVQRLREECLLPHALSAQSCILGPFVGVAPHPQGQWHSIFKGVCAIPTLSCVIPCCPLLPSLSVCGSRLSITSAEFLSPYEVILCISWVECLWTTLLLLQQNWLSLVSATESYSPISYAKENIALKMSLKKTKDPHLCNLS